MTNIELIKAGKLAIRNNHAPSLQKCYKFICPEEAPPYGNHEFYFFSDVRDCSNSTNLPTILATDLLKEIEQAEWKPKRGELVEIRDDGVNWRKRIFLAEIEGSHNPFICVSNGHEEDFKIGNTFNTCIWKHMRPIPTKHKVTQSALLAEYAKAKGIEVSQIEITD